eukprot:758619-Hanusia_phi.AAC.4
MNDLVSGLKSKSTFALTQPGAVHGRDTLAVERGDIHNIARSSECSGGLRSFKSCKEVHWHTARQLLFEASCRTCDARESHEDRPSEATGICASHCVSLDAPTAGSAHFYRLELFLGYYYGERLGLSLIPARRSIRCEPEGLVQPL